MKSKKLKLSILLFAISIFAILFMPHSVEASTKLNPNWYIGINEYRSNTTPANMGYSIKKPNNHLTIDQGYKIWEIVKYNSNNESDTNYSTDLTLYCVKAGVGFRELSTDQTTGSSKPAIKRATYTTAYNLLRDKAELLSLKDTNKTLYSLVSTDNYYGILALADLMYIPEKSTAQEKTELINAALKANNINPANYNTSLTDEDVDAVQQAALWYFTNYDGGDSYTNVFNQLGKKTWLFYKTTTMSEYTSLQDYNPIVDGNQTEAGLDRDEQATYLYDYLVNTAKANIAKYKDGTITPKSKVTLYTDPTVEDHQPVISIEKETPFDMALRKYITKVTTKEGKTTDLSSSTSTTRNPSIDTATIDTEYTATYKHRKDPVTVKTGDIVTYNISVYNEGTKAGRVTKIVDQLPTGLKFSSLSESAKNIYDATWDATTNKVTFVRKSTNTENLAAYTNGNLKSETIEFTCEVTKKASTTDKEVLTNVAWIAEEYNAVDNLTITKTKGDDRDSEPETKPNVNKDNMSNYKGNTSNKNELGDSNYFYKGEQDDDDFEKLVLLPNEFDLKLIKRITEVNDVKVPERIQSVDTSKLNTVGADGKKITTATYKMDKNPVSVKKGDIVKYGIRVYNEGAMDGYASEISEDVPEGLEFIWSEKLEDELNKDTTLTKSEKDAILYNQLIWTPKTINKDTKKIEVITTNYLAKGEGVEKSGTGTNLIKAFDSEKQTLNYKEVYVYMKVISDNVGGSIIRNEAAITKDSDSDGNDVTDRDSTPEEWKKENDDKYYDDNKKWPSYKEDDEDYDNIILQSFDLALRKFIIAVSPDAEISENEYLKDKNGNYTRAPQVDTSKLNTTGTDGKIITTATYNHPKDPVEVNKDDIVVYMLRVYNEGDIDGYATEIKDHLPPTLEFVEGEFNDKYNWKVSKDGRTVTTDYLKESKIEKAKKDTNGKIVLSYVEVPIMCKLKDTAKVNEVITNIADITKFTDGDKNTIRDRDSEEDNVKLPEDNQLPSYKDEETGDYVPGQQDDDDFEKVIIKPFDLALRKFITKVNNTEVNTRIPQVKYDSENNKITYEHTKDPVDVVTNDIVTYTIRVFNEGMKDGYAAEISDDMPAGLEFLPDNETNKEYRWVMYDKDGNKTEDVSKAVKIRTDYLSKEQGEAKMKEDTSLTENPYLLKAFDGSKEISEENPDNADVKVAFKVVEPNTSDKIIVNSAQISKDTDKNGKDIDDIDSTPDKWNEGEDDQDREYIKLNYFDLALRKWVTQAIVIENGKETVTQTGHTPEQDPEPIVKVDLNRKKLNKVTVKFRYSIRITNEGDIAGYAKEIKDYVPAGLKFVAADNPGWTDLGNNIITTNLLADKLLQPGESADVQVLLTWINGQNNMGLKTNIAEISKDYNDRGVPDRDSTPDNKKDGEDDIDDAPVMLSIATGKVKTYFALGFTVLIMLAGGIVLIKKFVL